MSEDHTVEPERFWIKTLHLENFRRFETLDLGLFDPQFNLIIGENGVGKSSVLAAIKQTCGTVMFNSISNLGIGNFRKSYNKSRNFPLIIEMVFLFENIYKSIRYRAADMSGGSLLFQNDHGMSINHNALFVASENLRTNPLLLFYGTNRAAFGDEAIFVPSIISDKIVKTDAISGWQEAHASSASLKIWFFKQIFETFLSSIRVKNVDINFLDVVRRAISECIDGVDCIGFDGDDQDITIGFADGRVMNYSTLSDGQKTYIAMVADIARRAIILNPHLGADAVKKTPGVILIDELDLHLHPRWQRTIIANLKKTFPLMQFFATTHSPIIIGEAKPEELVVLTETGQRQISRSLGMTSNDVLEIIMGAPARDEAIEQHLTELFNAIEDVELERATQLLKDLRDEVGDIPEILSAEAALWRAEHIDDEAAE